MLEKLGRNDPCPCGSGRLFQEMLPQNWPLSMAKTAVTIGGRVGFTRHFQFHLTLPTA
ncbi:MAG: SEC-C metal-binding domain-containing protein [Pseudomonadota bacterium]